MGLNMGLITDATNPVTDSLDGFQQRVVCTLTATPGYKHCTDTMLDKGLGVAWLEWLHAILSKIEIH